LIPERLLANEHLCLKLVTILQVNEALCKLEEVAVRLIRSEVNLENEVAVCWDLLLRWTNTERILKLLTGRLINNWKKCPVDTHWESELVLN